MLRAKKHTFYMICGGNIGGSENIHAHLKKSQTDLFSFNLAKSHPKLAKPHFCGCSAAGGDRGDVLDCRNGLKKKIMMKWVER